jgi:DNA polymerase-3 subunit gamma/tau
MAQSLFNQNRPYTWDSFKGQNVPITYLRNRVKDNKHPNAIYLYGKPGSGKSSLAFLYAKSVLDPNRQQDQDCISGKEAYEKDYANLTYHLVRDSSSTKETIEHLIQLSMSKPIPWDGIREDQYRKFIILDEVELIHPTTFSMLLNPLEYSPPTTTWILISMEPDKLAPITRSAIESRCKELRLNPLDDEDIISIIDPVVEDSRLASLIAKFSRGNARKAWSTLEVLQGADCLTIDKAEEYFIGSASKANRSRMWNFLAEGNKNKVVDIVSHWPKDRSILGPLLFDDLLELDNPPIDVIKEIRAWCNSSVEYPLEAALLSSMLSTTPPVFNKKDEEQPLVVEDTEPKGFKESYERWLYESLHQ